MEMIKIAKIFFLCVVISLCSFLIASQKKSPSLEYKTSSNKSKQLDSSKADDVADNFSPIVPLQKKSLLKSLKSQIRNEILSTLNSQKSVLINLTEFKSLVLSRLNRVGISIDSSDSSKPTYGALLEVKFEEPANLAHYLVAITGISINCGEDESFYLFSQIDTTWTLVLAQESNDYDTISVAQWLLGYSISPLDSNKSFYVATANVTPWCTSYWRGLRYNAWRIYVDPNIPKQIVRGEEFAWIGGDTPYTLIAKSDTLVLQFMGSNPAMNDTSDVDEIMIPYTVKYEIKQDYVRKLDK